MRSLSFRLKLFLAMMVMVLGVAGATLFVTQKRVEAAHERLFRERLDAQITYLPQMRDAELSRFKEKGRELAQSEWVQTALKEGAVNTLYSTTQSVLRNILVESIGEGPRESVLRPGAGPPPGGGGKGFPTDPKIGGNPPPREPGKTADSASRKSPRPPFAPASRAGAVFFGYFDAHGGVITPPEPGRFSLTPYLSRPRFIQQIAHVGATVPHLSAQQLGYIDLDATTPLARLLEIVVTPVHDPASRELLGAVVLGFPFADAELLIREVGDIQNGTWFEGRLYTRTIPESVRAELATRLPVEIDGHSDPRLGFVVQLGGIPHRVYYTAVNGDSPLPTAYKVGLYSLGSALRAQADLRWQIIGFSSVALLVALGFSLFFTHQLTEGARELVRGTAEIQRGNFTVQVPVRGRDEFSVLAAAFNEMADGLALKQRYHNVLHAIADKDVAQQLLQGKIELGGELREATILFCDIRGFTALTQNMHPAEVIQLLNEHMTALTRVITEHNGVVDKFIGDSIMALFGVPKRHGNDVLNAVLCAQQMITVRQQLNQTSRYQLQVGIGIASGRVLAGNMGSANRLNYTVLGERVNLASRLCSIAGPMEVVIGESVRETLADRLVVESREPIQLKGFDEPIRSYRLVNAQPAPVPA